MSTLTLDLPVMEAVAVGSSHLPQNGEQRLRMSYEEYLTAFDETTHAEWVNGEVIILMPPLIRHAQLVSFLHVFLGNFVALHRLGELLAAPCEVQLNPYSNAREPDLFFVKAEHAHRLKARRLEGPADLIIEIVSPESVARDRGEKFDEYEEAGVREYWIIDSRPGKQRADFWALDAFGRYRAASLDEDGVYRSIVLKGLWLDVNWLWQEPLMNPLLAFAQMSGLGELVRMIENSR